jgi:hypothetical protein
LPLALDHSPGFEARMPMALAIIGGNCVSTLFTLYVVPCAYNLFAYFEKGENESEHDRPVDRGGKHGQQQDPKQKNDQNNSGVAVISAAANVHSKAGS